MKRFCICSLWSHLNVLIFSPLTGGCSEGLGAFRFLFKQIFACVCVSGINDTYQTRRPTASLHFWENLRADGKCSRICVRYTSHCPPSRWVRLNMRLYSRPLTLKNTIDSGLHNTRRVCDADQLDISRSPVCIDDLLFSSWYSDSAAMDACGRENGLHSEISQK